MNIIMPKEKPIFPELLAEFLGSMVLVMTAISPIILFHSVLDSPINVAVIADAIAVAFVLCALIEVFGPISGAHFNPAVTVAMALENKIGVSKAALYILVQIVGGIIGTVFSHLMFLKVTGGLIFISNVVRNDYTYFAEIFGTFILVFAILTLVKTGSSRIPVVVGLLVGGELMSTSSTMFANPQVTIARMLTNSNAGVRPFDGMMFIIMQFIGALLAYEVYRLIFREEKASV